jgi:uncharacterized protein YjiS (DUF1127 family)
MAAVTQATATTTRVPLPVVLRVRAVLARLVESIAARRLRSRQMRELNAFSDRELWDVGLSRADFMVRALGSGPRSQAAAITAPQVQRRLS